MLKTIGIGIAGVVVGLLLGVTVAKDTDLKGVYEITTQNFTTIATEDITISDDAVVSGELTYLEKSEAVTGANTVTSSESGSTFYWTTTGATSTLPAVATATGTVFRFVVGSALATTNAVIASAEGDNLEGSMIVAGAVVDCDATDRIELIIDGENIGDYVEVRSNGQYWFITESNALTAGKLTCNG